MDSGFRLRRPRNDSLHRSTAALARLALLALALLVAMALRPAFAGPFEDALQKFQSDSYADTDAAGGALAASGHARAEEIVKALQDGRLLFGDGKLAIQQKSGPALDAATGEALAAPPAGMSPVRVNNRVRRAIEAAMGSLTLLSPDPAKRLQAAESVFRARDPEALPTIEGALAKEGDKRVRQAFEQARAAILLSKKDAPEAERIAAVDAIRDRGGQEALGLLRASLADASPALKAKLDGAIAGIESKLAILNNIQNVWYGLSLGSVLLLAAIGLAITFGVMGIINMAHGEMVMIGAYVTYLVQEVFRSSFPAYFGWSLPIAIPLAFLATALVGIVIERGIIRFLYGRPLETLLATWGVSLILQQAVRTIFGPTNREVGAPSYMSGSMDFFGLQITYGRLWIVCFALAVFVALQLILRATPFGLKMRAVTQNRRMAASMGIRTPRIDMMAFALGSGIAGIAGVALSQIDNVSPNLGQSYIVDSFMVVVFGGVGNLWGTLVAAFSLGIVNKFLEPYAGAVLAKIFVLVFIILFIQKRPRGLFALKGRAVEA